MRICLKERDFFTFRGVVSSRLDLMGISVYEHMLTRLGAEEDDGEGERIVLYPVYPFLTRDRLLSYVEEREGSYCFPGGYVVRSACPMSDSPRRSAAALGQGLFSLSDYAALLQTAARESARLHMRKGALVEEGAHVSFTARLEEGAYVGRGVRISGACWIGKNAVIEGDSVLEDCVIGENAVVRSSRIVKSQIGAGCTVGPNAYVRPDCLVGENCRIGDFVELKNAKVGKESKISHLAYVGDAELGERVNVGCGAVFVNYDGRKKSRIVVGDGGFIGSNCNLIAPLSVAPHVFLAAGTTLTKDLNEDDFCIARCRETVKPGRARSYYHPGED